MKGRRYQEGLAALDRLPPPQANHPYGQHLYARIHRALKDYEKAKSHAEAAYSLSKSNAYDVPATIHVKIVLGLISIAYKMKDFDTVRELFEGGGGKEASDARAYQRYARALDRQGHTEEAFSALQEAVRLAPNDPNNVWRALSGALKYGRGAEAEAYFERGRETGRPAPPIIRQVILDLRFTEERQLAEKILFDVVFSEECRDILPKLVEALWALCNVHAKRGEFSEAARLMKATLIALRERRNFAARQADEPRERRGPRSVYLSWLKGVLRGFGRGSERQRQGHQRSGRDQLPQHRGIFPNEAFVDRAVRYGLSTDDFELVALCLEFCDIHLMLRWAGRFHKKYRVSRPDLFPPVLVVVSHRLKVVLESAGGPDILSVEEVSLGIELLFKHECLEASAELAGLACETFPDDPRLMMLSADTKKSVFDREGAAEAYARLLRREDCPRSVHFELAELLETVGDDAGAIEALEKGFALYTTEELFLHHPRYLASMAGPLMRSGRIVEGWQHYQKRRDRIVLEAPPGTEIWKGGDPEGKKLLVLAEKGIGDEIRFASCYRDLGQIDASVYVSADPRFMSLLKRSFPSVNFVPSERNQLGGWRKRSVRGGTFRLSRALNMNLFCFAMQFDYLCMSGDLPSFFRRERAAFPSHEGYLVLDPDRRAEWRRRLEALGPGLKVGITWRSASRNFRRDQNYFSIEQLAPVLRTEGVHFVNLQYDDCEEELTRLEDDHGLAVHRWDDVDLKDDLEGVAALIKELDLVIAPHTMVKELSGAVGTQTLFMVPGGQAWVRWRADAETAKDIWHSSVLHVQSSQVGDKAEVVAKTATRLREFVLSRPAVSDWKPAHLGRHQGDPEGSAETVEAEDDKEPVEYRNAHGEVYVPAGAMAFANRRERDLEWERRQASFRAASARLFADTPQPARPEGVLLYSSQGSYKQDSLTVLGAQAVQDRGWSVVCLDKAGFAPGQSPDEDIAHFEGVLIAAGGKRHFAHRDRPEGMNFEWEVDWTKRICRAEGINVYGIIANRLGKEFRRYAVDITDPSVASRFEILLQTCDAALAVCIEAENRLAGRGLPVRFTGFEPNYPSTGVFKLYCGARGYKHGIEFVEIRQGYEKYFRAGRGGLVTMIEVQNITRYNLYSAAGLPVAQFESWLDRHGNDDEVVQRAKGWVNQDRSGHGKPSPEGEFVLERIRDHKANGGKVACLYGCIPFDFGHPWVDTGPAHFDLADWYNHTVATLRDTDTLLLIKPHPGEADFEQYGQPSQFFVEMLDEALTHNVSLLGHRWINNADLIPHLDFGIVWRGSIATELAIMGVPSVVCAPYSMADHVLDFPMPTGREDYEEMLRNPAGRIVLTEELRRRAAMVFEFYRSEVMIEYPFGWIAAKRSSMGPPVLSDAAVSDYLENGHPSVDVISDRIISAPSAMNSAPARVASGGR